MNSLEKPLITRPKNAELDSPELQTPPNTMANIPVSGEPNCENCKKVSTCVCITGLACVISCTTFSAILSLCS